MHTRGNMLLLVAAVAVALSGVLGTVGTAEARDFPVFSLPPPRRPPRRRPPAAAPAAAPPPPPGPPTTPPSTPPTTPPTTPPSTPPGGTQQSAPEPATLVTGLLGSGLLGLYSALRRKKRRVEPTVS